MESPAEQLALPLFEAGPIERQSDPEPAQRKSRPPVVSSRPQSQPPSTSAASALLTTQEAANLLRVHPRTVQRLVERGELSAVHLGAAVRFDPADVADLTARLKRRAAEAAPRSAEVVRPGRAARVSFADRLHSQQHEHRAAQA